MHIYSIIMRVCLCLVKSKSLHKDLQYSTWNYSHGHVATWIGLVHFLWNVTKKKPLFSIKSGNCHDKEVSRYKTQIDGKNCCQIINWKTLKQMNI